MMKPCPFCSSTDLRDVLVEMKDEGWRTYLECYNCGAMGPPKVMAPQREAAWDLRAPQPRIEAFRAVYVDAVVQHRNAASDGQEIERQNWHQFLNAFEQQYPEMVKDILASL